MNQEQLNAIKERVAKASHGPWMVIENEFVHSVSSVIAAVSKIGDVYFITHARKDVPALIEEVERLKRENEGLVIDRECAISNITNDFLDEDQRLRKALNQIMEAEAPNMEGWETEVYKIAREALGGEADE